MTFNGEDRHSSHPTYPGKRNTIGKEGDKVGGRREMGMTKGKENINMRA